MLGRDILDVPGSDGDSSGACFAQQGASSQGMGKETGLGTIEGKNGSSFSGQQEWSSPRDTGVCGAAGVCDCVIATPGTLDHESGASKSAAISFFTIRTTYALH